MSASTAKKQLRKKPCLCGKGGYRGPHEEGCPRYIDRSLAKKIRQVLCEARHPDTEGEWVALAEFQRIDLFVFRRWLDWPDEELKARTGIPGRFYRRVAYEIKVTRSDFRSEMRRPQKRAPAMALTHQFFFATPPGLVRRDEIPDGCGLVYVDVGTNKVTVTKRAPIRRPTRGLTTGDVVDLLAAEHLGKNAWEVRAELRRARARMTSVEKRETFSTEVLDRSRVAMIQAHGELLVAGSEWVGPWPPPRIDGNPRGQKRREGVRVRILSVNVDEDYSDLEREHFIRAHNGTVTLKPVSEIKDPLDSYGGEWIDPGDFLVFYRHEAEAVKPAPPSTSMRPAKRDPLRLVDDDF